jgi:hypothetical protein
VAVLDMETLKVLRAEPHIDSVVAAVRVRRDKVAQSLQMRQEMVAQVMNGLRVLSLTMAVVEVAVVTVLHPLVVQAA